MRRAAAFAEKLEELRSLEFGVGRWAFGHARLICFLSYGRPCRGFSFVVDARLDVFLLFWWCVSMCGCGLLA